MTNPLIIRILKRLKERDSACSIIDLVNYCDEDFISLFEKNSDPQIILFQKNFFVMNALYQIQRDIQTEGFSLTIFPLEICLIPSQNTDNNALTTRDTALADYYLDWSNLKDITSDKITELFTSFWLKYNAIDKVAQALATLDLIQHSSWQDIRQAYKKKIAVVHPDKGGCADEFITIREAYEILRFKYQGS